MKKIIFFLLFALPLVGLGQYDSLRVVQLNNGYGIDFNGITLRHYLKPPTDTARLAVKDSGYAAMPGGKWFRWNGHYWEPMYSLPTLAAVAFTGSYNDLLNKPTIPDTTSLSSRINLKLTTTDTAAMLAAYRAALNAIVSSGAAKLSIADTVTMLNAYRVALLTKMQYTDTAAMLVAYRNALNSLVSTVTGKLNILDTTAMLTNYRTGLLARIKASDTSAMLAAYRAALNAIPSVDTTSLSNRINANADTLDVLVGPAQSNGWGYNGGGGNTTINSKVFGYNFTTGQFVVLQIGVLPLGSDRPGVASAKPNSNNPAWHFAKRLQEETGAVVRVWNFSVGGSDIQSWTGANAVNYRFMDSVLTLHNAHIDYAIVDQGETNAGNAQFPLYNGMSDTAYYRKLVDTIINQNMRNEPWFGKSVPIILTGMADTPSAFNTMYWIIRAIASGDDPFIYFGDTRGLPTEDQVHFTGAATVTLGRERYWAALKNQNYKGQVPRVSTDDRTYIAGNVSRLYKGMQVLDTVTQSTYVLTTANGWVGLGNKYFDNDWTFKSGRIDLGGQLATDVSITRNNGNLIAYKADFSGYANIFGASFSAKGPNSEVTINRQDNNNQAGALFSAAGKLTFYSSAFGGNVWHIGTDGLLQMPAYGAGWWKSDGSGNVTASTITTGDVSGLSGALALRLNIADTVTMLTAYRNKLNDLQDQVNELGDQVTDLSNSIPDTTSLSDRINGKVDVADTASMLEPYGSATLLRVKYSDTASMLANYRTGLLARLLKTDTSTFLGAYQTATNARLKITDTAAMLAAYRLGLLAKVNIGDTSTMLSPYRTALNAQTVATATKLNIADTATMLTAYRNAININTAALATKVNYTDTLSMLANYQTQINDMKAKYALLPKRVLYSTTTKAFTGTTETEVYRDTIKNSIYPFGLNTALHIIANFDFANTANQHTFRLKINGTTVQQIQVSATNITQWRTYYVLANRNSLTTQTQNGVSNSTANTGFGANTVGVQTQAFNTATDVIVTVTLANAVSETANLQYLECILYP